MKKVLSIALALALCLTAMMGCFVVSADSANTLAVGSANITVGEDASVDVTLTSVGVWALRFDVVSDAAVTAVAIDDTNFSADLEGSRVLIQAKDNAYATNLTNATITLSFGALEVGNYNVAIENIDAGNYAESAVAFDTTAGTIVVAEAVVEPPVYEDPDLKMRGAGITMANGFALDFKVRKTMETSLGYSDIYITFEKPRYDADGNVTNTEVVTVTAAERKDDPTNAENFIYTLEGVQPQELATMIKATIYGTKDGNVYTGANVEYSVLTFASNQLKTLTAGATPSPLQVACADMIYFGAAVQEYGVYNLANPILDAANAKIGSTVWQDAATKEISRELVNAQTNTALDGATVRVRSAGVVLSSKVILYFNCADLGVTTLENRDNYLLRATYVDSEGNDKTFDLVIDENNQALLDTLYSTELGTVVTAYMIDKTTGEAVSNTVTYSIETFISKNLTNATHGSWCSALIKYGDAVRAYAGL